MAFRNPLVLVQRDRGRGGRSQLPFGLSAFRHARRALQWADAYRRESQLPFGLSAFRHQERGSDLLRPAQEVSIAFRLKRLSAHRVLSLALAECRNENGVSIAFRLKRLSAPFTEFLLEGDLLVAARLNCLSA